MGAADTDIHERIFDEIALRINSLQSGAPAVGPDGQSWSEDEVEKALTELQDDRSLLQAHWRTETRVTSGYPPANSKACGNPQPCPHVLGLASKYGLLEG